MLQNRIRPLAHTVNRLIGPLRLREWKAELVLHECIQLARGIEGDFAEFGVHEGNTFLKILKQARLQGKIALAFDSFEGMAKPSPYDIDPTGACKYPEGRLRLDDGHLKLRQRVFRAGFFENDFKII